MPQEQIYIPCHNGLDCRTTTIPAEPLSVIAGHFTWAELERGGIDQSDCMVRFLESSQSPALSLPPDVTADLGGNRATERNAISSAVCGIEASLKTQLDRQLEALLAEGWGLGLQVFPTCSGGSAITT